MDKDSFFYNLDKDIQDEINKRLPNDIDTIDVYYDTAIQYLISLSHIYELYDQYALQLSVELHHKNTQPSFIETIEIIQNNKDINGNTRPLLNSEFYTFIRKNQKKIKTSYDKIVKNSEPFVLNYFGWKTLTKSYLIKTDKGIVERLDHMWYRVALFLHTNNFDKVEKTFQILRTGQAIHATPTLFNAGLIKPQMASCFLLGTEDSVQGIYKTISDAAVISKYAGGIGIHISNIRGKNSYIYGTNGYSNGIMPMLRVYNDTSRYIDQCFESCTPIITSRGIIPISKIIPHQDYVLTIDGTFQKVVKKILHNVKDDIIRIKIDTPWDETVSYVMTDKHDLYFFNPNTSTKEFISVEKAGFGFRTTYIEPNTIDIDFFEGECFILGFLYANMEFVSNNQWRLTINDTTFHDNIILFIKRYYKNNYDIQTNEKNQKIYFINIDNQSIIDAECLKTNDFPFEFCLANRYKVEQFYKGYTWYPKNNIENNLCFPKLQFMKYRLRKNDFGCINSVEKITGKNLTLYDLEIEKNHNYQTILGLAHNGGGKRKGAFAMYIEPWHIDIYDFVLAKRNIGNEEERTRDLFLGLWIPDEFMRRIENDQDWYLMSENDSPGLSDVWGPKFEELYQYYIDQNKFIKKIKARELWFEILKSQIETGNPYILYKDTCNRFSNQQNLGTIKSSNLCCEIIEYSDNKEYAVCNLSSISLKSCLKYKNTNSLNFWIYGKENCIFCNILKNMLDSKNISYQYFTESKNFSLEEKKRIQIQNTFPIVFLNDKHIGGFMQVWNDYLKPEFDFNKLGDIVRILVENLNIIIDKNEYPLKECRTSNMKNRPIGIGVTGLADVFLAMLEPYDSKNARQLNKKIFETIYYYALKTSHSIAITEGSYETFKGSPLSKGIFHFEQYKQFNKKLDLSPEYDWEELKKNIIKDGVRNSLMVAPMPTASTSQILGNTESFEPLTSNFYVRRTLAGEFYVVNKYLRRFLMNAGIWNNDFIHSLGLTKGSILNLDLPSFIKDVFRTVWEIPQKNLIEMAADRQMFIDQSQSFNIYLSKPDPSILTKIHFYGWKKQLKTGCYYLRTKPALSSQNVIVDLSKEICTSCSA